MSPENPEINEKSSNKQILHQAIFNTAVVAGIFSIIVFGLLVVNYLQVRLLDPMRTERLENLKLQLAEKPTDEQILTQIRQLDLQIRKDKISRLNFSHQGAILLVAGIIIFISAAKIAADLKRKLPMPQPAHDIQTKQVRHVTLARWSIVSFLVLTGVFAVLFAVTKKVDFSQGSSSYPSEEQINKNWPRFRGPQGSGVSFYTNIPTKWDGKTGKGIIWKTKVPLPGNNSPVIWDDKIFLCGANKNQRQVYCFDRIKGRLIWQKDVTTAIPDGNIPDIEEATSYAAPTMTTDGKRVFAIFPLGDVACFDFKGKNIWNKNLGLPHSMYGYATSLEMYQNLLIIQYDQASADDGKSRIFALDAFSGNTVWEVKRPVGGSWTTPIVAKIGEQHQLITCADPCVISYNPSNGAEIWRAECVSGDLAPSPIYAGDFVFAVSPYNKLSAIKPDGAGDVTTSHIAWTAEGDIPDISSPVSDGKYIYLATTEGILSCIQISDGKKLWFKDVREEFNASPSIVGKYVYLICTDGTAIIIESAEEYREIARNELGEEVFASPAFADGRIYIRSEEYLYCIGNTN